MVNVLFFFLQGVDALARRTIWDVILSRKRGHCIVLTTHFMEEAEILADHIVIMSAGEVQVRSVLIMLDKLR